MALNISTNPAAQAAHARLIQSQEMLSQSMQRLTSGLKVNTGADRPEALVLKSQTTNSAGSQAASTGGSQAASSAGSQVGAATSTTISSEAKSRFSALTSGSGASADLATLGSAANLPAADSRIHDVNVATEVVNVSQHHVLLQAGITALASANQSSQSSLNLLRD